MSEWCKVLIVDDELLVRQGIRHHLNWEQYGFRIVGEAANGQEALKLVERLDPHIVITDIVMPVLDGEELTRILKARYPQIEVVVLSSYGEFQYVCSTFQSGVADYMLKPKLESDELLHVLLQTARKLPGLEMRMRNADAPMTEDQILDRLLDRLLAGYEVGEEAGDSACLAGYFAHKGYILIGADPGRMYGDPQRRYMDALIERVSERLGKGTYPAMLRVLNVPASDHRLLMLVNLPRDAYEQAVKDVRKCAEEHAAVAPEVVWVVSEMFTDVLQLPHVYREELAQLLSYRFYEPERVVLVAADLPPVPDVQELDMRRLMDDIRRKQAAAAFARIRQYTDQAVRHYVTSPFELKSKLGNLIFHVALGVSEYADLKLSAKQLDELKYSSFKAIDEAQSATEAAGVVEVFLSEMEKSGAASFTQSDKMRQLLAYIDEHYSEPLRLSSLAEHFHFHPSYLSGYFSTHHAEGFSEYLNKTRIAKACELLRESELSISDISAGVGYSDHSYFTKVFKKHTGMSPSHYRRQFTGKGG